MIFSCCCILATNTTRGDSMNATKLKNKILEKGLNIAKTAELIGMNKSSLYRKLNGFEKFTVAEAVKLKNVLDLNNFEALEIFLPEKEDI